MTGSTAVLVIGIGLSVTFAVGMLAQMMGRGRRVRAQSPQAAPAAGARRDQHDGGMRTSRVHASAADAIREQQEDFEAVNKSIEEARSELHWLREQVVKERSRLDQLKRQAQAMGNGQPPREPPWFGPGPRPQPQQVVLPPVDSPWVILGLRPGSSVDDIRRRYRLLSRVWHPDRFADGPPELRQEAELMMARLNRAHTALSEQPARKQP